MRFENTYACYGIRKVVSKIYHSLVTVCPVCRCIAWGVPKIAKKCIACGTVFYNGHFRRWKKLVWRYMRMEKMRGSILIDPEAEAKNLAAYHDQVRNEIERSKLCTMKKK